MAKWRQLLLSEVVVTLPHGFAAGAFWAQALTGAFNEVNVFAEYGFPLAGLDAFVGINNLQFGTTANWEITESVALFGHANHSFALSNLKNIDEGDVSWVGVGLTASF